MGTAPFLISYGRLARLVAGASRQWLLMLTRQPRVCLPQTKETRKIAAQRLVYVAQVLLKTSQPLAHTEQQFPVMRIQVTGNKILPL